VSFASGTVVECFVFGFGFSLGFLFLPAPFMFYGDQIKYYDFQVSFTIQVSFIFAHERKVLTALLTARVYIHQSNFGIH